MKEKIINIAIDMINKGQRITLEDLAHKTGVSRSTIHRRTGGMKQLIDTLKKRGVDENSFSARDHLINATRSIISTNGVLNVSVESIADMAGVSTVSVYRLFGNRESMIMEALIDVFPLPQMNKTDIEKLPLAQALEEIAISTIRFAGNYPGLMALMLLPSSRDRAEIMEIYGVQQDLRSKLTSLFNYHEKAGVLPKRDPLRRVCDFSGLCLGASLLMHDVKPLAEEDIVPRARSVVNSFLKIEGIVIASL